MDSLIAFAQQTSPLTFSLLVIGGLVHLVILLLKNTGVLDKIRGTQVARTVAEAGEFEKINQKLDLVMTNHLHDLPSMRDDITDIKKSISKISNEQVVQGNRLTRLETIIDKKL